VTDDRATNRNRQIIRATRIAFALFAAWYVGRPVLDPFDYVILRDIILATHEAGHVLFLPFGEFLMVLGGSVFQVLLPCVFVGYFARRGDWYAASIVLFWVAFSLTDLGMYIGDARARQLPLLSGDPTTHDWTFLLVQTGLLEHDRTIAGMVRALGVVLYCVALAAALYNGWWQKTAPQSAPGDDAATPAQPAPPAAEGAPVNASRWREQ
jgi:hypothetical protein